MDRPVWEPEFEKCIHRDLYLSDHNGCLNHSFSSDELVLVVDLLYEGNHSHVWRSTAADIP